MARILIVDDDRDVANLLAHRLHEFGHACLVAASGPIALREVGLDFPIELALLDINLTGMNGFDLLEELRRHPELDNPNLPAVFLSGSKDPAHAERAQALGSVYLPKPFVSGELQGAILQALKTPSTK